MKAFGNFAANESYRGSQAFHGALGFCVITFHGDKDPRGTGIIGESYAAHASQPNSWVPKFTLKDREDLLAQRFPQPSAMIFCSPALHHGPPLG